MTGVGGSLVSLGGNCIGAIVNARMRWDDYSMPARTKTTMRFLFLSGLLLLEVSLVIAFYVLPQFQTHAYNPHPNIGLEMDAVLQEYPILRIAIIAFLGIFLFGNIGLVMMVWRAFKNLRIETQND
jgi:hypothetical protein